MKAVRLYGVCDLRQEDVRMQETDAGEILLKVKATAICGTDVRMYLNGAAGIDAQHPGIIGHEISGIIEEVGEGVHGYEPGMRVCVAPNFGCGVCDACISGNTHLCSTYQALGINLDGGLAEYVKIPAKAVAQGNVVVMADQVGFGEASIVEPLSCVYNGQEQVGIRPGDKVLVIGAGPIGVMHAMLAKMQGAGVVMMNDLSKDRLDACRKIDDFIVTVSSEGLKDKMAELTGGRGLDVCIVACPSPQAQTMAVELMGLFGRVLFFGGLPASRQPVPIDTNLVHYKQLSLHGSTRASLLQYRKLLEFVQSGRLDLKKIITATYSLDQIDKAFEAARNAVGMKHVIVF